MARQKRIRYGIDMDTGLVVSEYDNDQMAIPVLDWEGMNPENGFETNHNLEKHESFQVQMHMLIHWTRKIPIEIKNIHRKFWGMKPLKNDK